MSEAAFQAAVAKGMFNGLAMPPRVVVLPWPAHALHPNSRPHWAEKAKATKKARADACTLTRAAMGPTKPKWAGVRLAVTFCPPLLNRRRDLDGMVASNKAHFDGIADALGVDDSLFQTTFALGEPVKGGAVRVEIRPI
jgi:crossover junction endodeoxyribonuclease RusA